MVKYLTLECLFKTLIASNNNTNVKPWHLAADDIEKDFSRSVFISFFRYTTTLFIDALSTATLDTEVLIKYVA